VGPSWQVLTRRAHTRRVGALGQKQESGGAASGEAQRGRGLGSLLGSSARSRVIPGSISQWRVIQQAAISRPNSFPSRPRGPSWTSRRPTRSAQSRPRRRFPPSMRAFASPLRRVELAKRSSHIFSPPVVRLFTDAQNFLKQGPWKTKEMAMKRASGVNQILRST
jgi:hypothetical protein